MEEYNAQASDEIESQLLTYDEFVCDNALVFSAQPVVPEEVKDENPMVTYWSDTLRRSMQMRLLSSRRWEPNRGIGRWEPNRGIGVFFIKAPRQLRTGNLGG